VADDHLVISADEPKEEGQSLTVIADGAVAVLPLAEMVDLDAERSRLRRELDEAMEERNRAERQLGNASFVARAPEHVVQVQRDRLARAAGQIAVLESRLAALNG
jgi:valyl-tRNA synthetase